jgi:hypothetical protein
MELSSIPDRRRLGAAVLYAVALWAACSIPGHSLPDSILLSWDKLWHLVAFAALLALWVRAGFPVPHVAAGAFAYGAAIEAWQHVAPIGRFFDPLDLLANAAGIAIGVILVAVSRVIRPPA